MKIGLLISACIFLLGTSASFPDTIYLKDGKEVKGIIVEEYSDRIVMSTYKGEKPIEKRIILKMEYDMPEQNLVKLGDKYMSLRQYGKAYFYYDKALKANPDYKPARDKINYVTGYFFRSKQQEKIKDVEKMQELEDWPVSAQRSDEDYEALLLEHMGIRIGQKSGYTKITKVSKNSPADRAGVKQGDFLVSVWGQLAGYMSLEEIGSFLMKKAIGEIRVGIQRNVKIKKDRPYQRSYKNIIDGKMDMLFDGLTVTEIADGGRGKKAGLRKNDLVVAINGAPTRYMPFQKAARLIEDRKHNPAVLTVRRDVTIWRE